MYIYIYIYVYIIFLSLYLSLSLSLSLSMFGEVLWLLLAMAEDQRRSPSHPRHERRTRSFPPQKETATAATTTATTTTTRADRPFPSLFSLSSVARATATRLAGVGARPYCALGYMRAVRQSAAIAAAAANQSVPCICLPHRSPRHGPSSFLALARDDPSLSACASTLFTITRSHGDCTRDLITSSTLTCFDVLWETAISRGCVVLDSEQMRVSVANSTPYTDVNSAHYLSLPPWRLCCSFCARDVPGHGVSRSHRATHRVEERLADTHGSR